MANLVENKKVRFDYELLDEYEAGIELLGTEVKSVKNHQGSLEGARVIERGGELYLVGANIPPYQSKNAPSNYDPERTRRLLCSQKEIEELGGRGNQKGLTIVPVVMYNKGKFIKLRIALARGKKKFDKRETIKKRDMEMDLKRTLKDR